MESTARCGGLRTEGAYRQDVMQRFGTFRISAECCDRALGAPSRIEPRASISLRGSGVIRCDVLRRAL
jgi:hypothetical protein